MEEKKLFIKEVMPGIFLMDEAHEATGYLVVGNERACVIDTMNGYNDLYQAVRELTDKPLTVVNTHGHPDHIFGNMFFQEAYLHPADRELARMFVEDPEYKKMLEQLAADAFLPENATEEQVRGAREEQQKGLRTYFETLKVNYNRMEGIFGLEAEPDLVFLMEHLEEIDSLGGNIQVDFGLLKGDNGVLDMNDPGDARLFHQVAYFGGLSTGMKGLRGMIAAAAQLENTESMQVTQDILHAALRVGEDSRQYLMKNPLVPAPLEQKQGAA